MDAHTILSIVLTIFSGVVGVLCIAIKLYLKRVEEKLDTLEKRHNALEEARRLKWDEHQKDEQQRELLMENRTTRAELLIEVIYKYVITGDKAQSGTEATLLKKLLDGELKVPGNGK